MAVREAIFEVGRPRRGRYHAVHFYPGVLAALVPPATDRRRLQRLTPVIVLAKLVYIINSTFAS